MNICQVCEKLGGHMTAIHNASENSNYTEFMAPMMSYPEVSEACDYFSVGTSFSQIFCNPTCINQLIGDNFGPTFHLAQAKTVGPVETNPVRCLLKIA